MESKTQEFTYQDANNAVDKADPNVRSRSQGNSFGGQLDWFKTPERAHGNQSCGRRSRFANARQAEEGIKWTTSMVCGAVQKCQSKRRIQVMTTFFSIPPSAKRKLLNSMINSTEVSSFTWRYLRRTTTVCWHLPKLSSFSPCLRLRSWQREQERRLEGEIQGWAQKAIFIKSVQDANKNKVIGN